MKKIFFNHKILLCIFSIFLLNVQGFCTSTPTYIDQLPDGSVRFQIAFNNRPKDINLSVCINSVVTINQNLKSTEVYNDFYSYCYIVPALAFSCGDKIQVRFNAYHEKRYYYPGPDESRWSQVFIYNGPKCSISEPLNIISPTGAACMGISETRTYYLSGTYGKNNISWKVFGDLKIISSDNKSITIQSAPSDPSRSAGYGKGMITVNYTDNNLSACGLQSKSLEIYKSFPPSNDLIKGPSCIKEGDMVTYSIKDIVSVNINQRIGIDSYKWNIPHTSGQRPWQVLNYSGDSSAITIKIGEVSVADTIITVDIGQCNMNDGLHYSYRLLHNITSLSYSEVPPSCLSASMKEAKVKLKRIPGVTYQWELKGNQWAYLNNTNNFSQDSILINIGNSPGKIIVTAIGPCNTYKDTITINRSLSSDLFISGPTCFTPGQVSTYSLNGVSDIPLNWILPTGWSVQSNDIHSSTISVLAGQNEGIIQAEAMSCAGLVSKRLTLFPENPGVVTGAACNAKGSTKPLVYSISPVQGVSSYHWTYPGNWIASGVSTANSITLVPDGKTPGNVTVTTGNNVGCQSLAGSSLAVQYPPDKPQGIIRDPLTCVNSGIKGLLTLHVDKPSIGQLYQWTVPNQLGIIVNATPNNTSITIETTGINSSPGSPYKVWVEAGNQCGSESIVLDIEVKGNGSVLNNLIDPEGDLMILFNAPAGSAFSWYADDVAISGETKSSLSLRGNLTKTVCVNVQSPNNGCITRLCDVSNKAFKSAAAPMINSYEDQIVVYPNPTSGDIKVIVPSFNEQAEVYMLDSKGDLLIHTYLSIGENQIELASMNSGEYVLVFIIDQLKIIKKISVSR